MASAASSSGSNTKISWRLREFQAHTGTVSCAALAKSSGRLLATGGDDCRVNIWAVSKENCIMSLRGHQSAVECVELNPSEDKVAAGSQSGSIRVWDLEAAKSLRTLMGHKSNVTSLSFHPFGNFLASSSMDTNIKLWDVRRKGYVFRFRGHSEAVRSLSFSPDGKWLGSAGDDGSVKLWDLSQGKTITEFTSHSAAVSVIQFHPNEYLLASGSSDRTIKLWDLEKFSLVGSLEGDTTAVRCVLFSPDGSCLFSGSSDSLRVFGWEPDRCFDLVPVGWGKVSDMSVCNQQLIAVSHQLSVVSTFVVDLKKVKRSGSVLQNILQDERPLAQPTATHAANANVSTTTATTALRRSYERPTTSCGAQRVRRTEGERRSPGSERRSPGSEGRSPSEDEAEEKVPAAEIHNAEDYEEIFQPKNAISRTPPKMADPFPAPPEDDGVASVTRQQKEPISPFPDKLQLKVAPLAASTPVLRVEPTVVSSVKPLLPQAPPPPSKHSDIIPSSINAPIGLNVADFLPVPSSQRGAALSEEELLGQMRKGHDTMCVMLSSRLKNLVTLRTLWTPDDPKSALDAAVSINDLSIVVDLLNIINLQPSVWKLDLCTTVLPQIDKLLQSKYESYTQTGCASLRLIMKHFWPLISDTLKATPSVGVDITREERHQKCQLCYKLLRKLMGVVSSRAGLPGRHGSSFKELQLLMAPLDDMP